MSLKPLRSRAQKRALDLILGVALLVLSLPLQAIAGIAVRTSSPGPVLFRARRVGKGGTEFTMFKFRTMRSDMYGIGVTAGDDARVTKIGRLLRATKIDELPQLFQVVRGTMSLVGPRPEDPRYTALYTPEQRRVFDVMPGITGPSIIINEEGLLAGDPPLEVERRYTEEVMPMKLEIDLRYIDDWSILQDLKIICRTGFSLIPIFNRRGRNQQPLGYS